MDFPQHEFSGRIDGRLSFCGEVPRPARKSVSEFLQDVVCDGNIMLEPRITEYVRRKEFNKNNGVIPSIRPEDEFMITKRDTEIIRKALQGRRDVYSGNSRGIDSQRYVKPVFSPSSPARGNLHGNGPQASDVVQNKGMFMPNIGQSYYDGLNDAPLNTSDRESTRSSDAYGYIMSGHMGKNKAGINVDLESQFMQGTATRSHKER